jgi:hypothetical protein
MVNRTGQQAIQALSVGGIRQTAPPAVGGTLIRWARTPGHYIQTYTQNQLLQSHVTEVAALPNCAGIGLWFTWRHLEPTRGNYNFAVIEDALDRLDDANLSAQVYVEGRSFGGTTRVCPDYLATEIGSGGIFTKANGGTTPKYWDPDIADRELLMYEELADAIAGHPALAILRQSELDSGVTASEWSSADFSPADYMAYMRDWAASVREDFPEVNIVAPANFTPGGPQDMEPWVQYCYERRVGLGGPDVYPQPQTQNRGPTWTDRVIKGQHYIGGDPKLDSSWNNAGFDYRGKIFYLNEVQDPDMGKGYVWYPQQFYDYAKSVIAGLGQNCMAWWRKNYTWANRPAAEQTYYSIEGQSPPNSQTDPTRIIKSWLQMGGHAMATTPPAFYNGQVDL